ncbi:origin recognition complex subunit 4 [Oleoguttula sp. CCFEE 5521]
MDDTDSPRASKRRKTALPARYSHGGDTVTVAPRKTPESALERLKAKRAAQSNAESSPVKPVKHDATPTKLVGTAQRNAQSSPAKAARQDSTPTKPKPGFFKAFTKPRGETVTIQEVSATDESIRAIGTPSPAKSMQTKLSSARIIAAQASSATPTKQAKSRPSGIATPVQPAPSESRPIVTPSKPAQGQASEMAVGTEGTVHGLPIFQQIAMERCTGKRPIPITNLKEEYAKVNTVISQTILSGESNSMLLIGARGSGKTTIVNQMLEEHTAQHGNDFHVVRLNGFSHTDDKIALREIWRQLGREMEIEGEEGAARNYADTLTTLLALLSTPAELGQSQEDGQVTKSVIFILDEFEIFASHPRQTLLYNLFDIAQSRKAPIAVLGLTTRIEVAETLEKRVKSRFSHRFVHLSLPKSYNAFLDVCKAALTLDPAQLSEGERVALGKACGTRSKSTGSPRGPLDSCVAAWNYAISTMLSSPELDPTLRRMYYTDKSIPVFLTALLYPLATLDLVDIESKELSAVLVHSLLTSPHLTPADNKLTLLPTFSTLELALLICAARQTAIHSTELVSFNLVYEEYKVLASKAKLQAAASGAMGGAAKVWGREVARDAWRGLLDAGLIIAEGGGDGAGRADVGLEEIGESGADLGGWGRWCKEI